MDHAGVVVEDLAAAIAFFVELGLMSASGVVCWASRRR
jgi:catechol 2,3-dioxygenase-like lactoylglutathione lyase family enzyme